MIKLKKKNKQQQLKMEADMRANKIITGMVAIAVGWLSFVSVVQAGVQGDPIGLLKYISGNMIRELKKNKATLKTKPGIVYKLAYRYVVPYADLNEMSKRVLPPSVWRSASSSQKSQFKKEFTRLVIRTYASALTSYKDQEAKFFPLRGSAGRNVQIRGEIVGSSGNIQVSYRLLKSGGKWKLYDMSVEGVSLISSFRSQFAGILANGNMSTLLKRLSSHNKG
jgi:phospholipid transport system substrate-binding protein